MRSSGPGPVPVKSQGRPKRHFLLRDQPVACGGTSAATSDCDGSLGGGSRMYRDWYRHGDILSNKFMETWYPRRSERSKMEIRTRPKIIWMNEASTGTQKLSKEQLAATRAHNLVNARAREMDDDWYKDQSPDWSKVVVPFVSPANWAGFGCTPAQISRHSPKPPRNKSGWKGILAVMRNGSTCPSGWRCRNAFLITISRASKTAGIKITCPAEFALTIPNNFNRARRTNGRSREHAGPSCSLTQKPALRTGERHRRRDPRHSQRWAMG